MQMMCLSSFYNHSTLLTPWPHSWIQYRREFVASPMGGLREKTLIHVSTKYYFWWQKPVFRFYLANFVTWLTPWIICNYELSPFHSVVTHQTEIQSLSSLNMSEHFGYIQTAGKSLPPQGCWSFGSGQGLVFIPSDPPTPLVVPGFPHPCSFLNFFCP